VEVVEVVEVVEPEAWRSSSTTTRSPYPERSTSREVRVETVVTPDLADHLGAQV
jgi:hypothetical protein